MATGGVIIPVRPSIRVGGEFLGGPDEQRRKLAFDQRAVFLVNHALRSEQSIAVGRGGRAAGTRSPSVYVADSDGGQWGVAYTNEALVVVKLREAIPQPKLRLMLLKILALAGKGSLPYSPVPGGIAFRTVCPVSGLLATSVCPEVIREAFVVGTEPVDWCPLKHEPVPRPDESRSNAQNKRSYQRRR
jgi:hypothetical protein